jgi:hypothetical protein
MNGVQFKIIDLANYGASPGTTAIVLLNVSFR